MRKRWLTGLAIVSGAAMVLGGCGTKTDEAPPGTAYAEQLKSKVAVDAMMGHLQRLQDIADQNGGTRVVGSPGFDASVDYVAATLRDKGFDVTTPEFTMSVFNVARESLSVNGAPVEAHTIDFSGSSPPGGATGRLVVAPTDDDPGCTASDYDGIDVSDAVVLVDRGTCFLFEKAVAATERGAVALIVANDVEEEAFSGGMSEEDGIKIPVVSVSLADGTKLHSQRGTATVVVDASVDEVTTRNVIAQTKTGATDDVVMVGGHLDSVSQGPGINDNGSGAASVLETALQMGPSPAVQNAVRFAFWAGEEQGLYGSAAYLESLDVEALKDIALYLNFDMMASPNTCYFTSDADQSLPPDPEADVDLLIPEGSPGIERTLVETIKSAGKTPQNLPFDGRSDYDSFTRVGIPAGNFDTGADDVKTAEQVELWGGTTGKQCDPNYHSAKDTIENVDRGALELNGGVIAYVVGVYAQDEGGRNGVPARADRTRHPVPDE